MHALFQESGLSRLMRNNYSNVAQLKDLMTAPPMTAARHAELMRKRIAQRRMRESVDLDHQRLRAALALVGRGAWCAAGDWRKECAAIVSATPAAAGKQEDGGGPQCRKPAVCGCSSDHVVPSRS
eukprot:gene12137-biopygen10794